MASANRLSDVSVDRRTRLPSYVKLIHHTFPRLTSPINASFPIGLAIGLVSPRGSIDAALGSSNDLVHPINVPPAERRNRGGWSVHEQSHPAVNLHRIESHQPMDFATRNFAL